MEDIRNYLLQDVRTAIIDDHEVVLEGLRSYMQKHGMQHVSTFRASQDLLQAAERDGFDLYIIDVELPDMPVDELIDRVRAIHPEARIIINTMHEELWVVRKVMEKRVNGVIYKSAHLDQLLDAVVQVMNGQDYFCPKFRRAQHRVSLQADQLTPRELDVLKAIAEGCSTKQIAQKLYISENTVETHRQKLFAKMRVHNMADLVVKAIACGYIMPPDSESGTS